MGKNEITYAIDSKNRGILGKFKRIFSNHNGKQQKGIMYTFGRDNRFRPIFVLNAFMINPKEVITALFSDLNK